jgi:LmbE family N-acetylglucosaminyl deacetylase
MIELRLAPPGARLKVLCLGAHSDDIEIGAGGTVLKILRRFRRAEFTWVVFSAQGVRRDEAARSARSLLAKAARTTLVLHEFRDGYFPFIGASIKDAFESLKAETDPDLILTHAKDDLHQDHALIAALTWNTFRDHLIWEYEVPKYDGDLGTPNLYVHLDLGLCRAKARHLRRFFKSQAGNAWFDEETFLSLARLRGIESNAPGGHAEGFTCRKMVGA